jgi:hypothetical protein
MHSSLSLGLASGEAKETFISYINKNNRKSGIAFSQAFFGISKMEIHGKQPIELPQNSEPGQQGRMITVRR